MKKYAVCVYFVGGSKDGTYAIVFVNARDEAHAANVAASKERKNHEPICVTEVPEVI